MLEFLRQTLFYISLQRGKPYTQSMVDLQVDFCIKQVNAATINTEGSKDIVHYSGHLVNSSYLCFSIWYVLYTKVRAKPNVC